jgi:DNA polymerase III epsilon subunit-like protein
MAVPTVEAKPDVAALVALQAESLRGPVACVDLETTGGMAAHHRVIEVGIVLLEHGEIVEEWSTLVHRHRRFDDRGRTAVRRRRA